MWLRLMKRWSGIVNLVLFLTISGCRQNSNLYKIIDRKSDPGGLAFQPWVKLVLLHDGKKFDVRCNNYKGAPDTAKAVPCNLQVGDLAKCEAFSDRMSDEAGGYDLICGEDREHGKLITSAKNELLQIEDYDPVYERKRDAEIAKLPKIPVTIVYDEWWSSDYAANGAEMRCELTVARFA
jgi:hypothetical protein